MKFFVILLALLVITAIIAVIIAPSASEEASDEWNDGICYRCGGKYELISVYHIRNFGDRYIFVCPSGHSIKCLNNPNNAD